MIRLLAAIVIVLACTAAARADDWRACAKVEDPDPSIQACTGIIASGKANRANLALAYANRGAAYGNKGDYDRDFADANKAIDLNPRLAVAYINRGAAYGARGDYDHEIADQNTAIGIDPKSALAYMDRGAAYAGKADYDHAIADQTTAIRLNPQLVLAYNNRGVAYGNKGDYDRELADENAAIRLNPSFALAYSNRGVAYGGKGDHDHEIADETTAIQLNPQLATAYGARGMAYAAKGEMAKALLDFRLGAQLIPATDPRHGQVLALIAEVEKRVAAATAAPAPSVTPPSASSVVVAASSVVKRVALVIGNSDYVAAGTLANPRRDAQAIAAALRGDGFEVTEVENVTRTALLAALNQFSDVAAKADWATIYFAGHGLQLEGTNYLVPVDAKLAVDRDVPDEAVALDRVVDTLSGVRTFGLIVVDACRNNPFLAQMHFTSAGRARVTRGLARVAAHGSTLVEFSAQDGQEALDGDSTGNSPFASALAKRLGTPGLEVGKLLRQVRVDVLAATANQQEPMFSGNLPADDLFFRVPG
jgi:tetratricopeptide (TPR) repeat protein